MTFGRLSDETGISALLAPPFYAAIGKGVVDMERHYAHLFNKVRPLVADGGLLIAVNNALFVSGAE